LDHGPIDTGSHHSSLVHDSAAAIVPVRDQEDEAMRMTNLFLATSAAIRCSTVALLLAGGISAASAQNLDDGSAKILKAMSDYIAAQKSISLTFDSSIEVVTDKLQKIQFDSTGHVLLSRPDKLRATRTGGYADVELVSDGKTVTLFGKNADTFAQTEAPRSLDELVNRLRDNLGVSIPGADLLSMHAFDELTADTVEGKHIGRGVVEGVECEHLAFRGSEADWQIWIATGPDPIPRKYVITSKDVAGSPQYTLVIRDWKANVQPAADAFVFKDPDAKKKVAMDALKNLDEVPAGMPAEVRNGPARTTGEGK